MDRAVLETLLQNKLAAYKAAESEHLANANANHGAALAIEDLLKELEKAEDSPTKKEAKK
jgi:hypothetical protein